MIRKVFAALVAPLATLLAACDEAPSVVRAFDRGGLVWSTFFDTTKDGPLYVRILGNPFGGDRQPFYASVLDEMGGAIQERPARYTIRAEESKRPHVRVIMVFDGAGTINGTTLCKEPPPDLFLGGEAGRIHLRAVFCNREELLSDVEGVVKKGPGSDDKWFRMLVFHVTRQLLMVDDR